MCWFLHTGTMQLNMFENTTKQLKEKALQEAILSIRSRYGKNPILKGMNYEEANEELGRTMAKLRRRERVTVVYYESDAGEYVQLTGEVTKVDGYWRCLQLRQVIIDFDEIWDVDPAIGNGNS